MIRSVVNKWDNIDWGDVGFTLVMWMIWLSTIALIIMFFIIIFNASLIVGGVILLVMIIVGAFQGLSAFFKYNDKKAKQQAVAPPSVIIPPVTLADALNEINILKRDLNKLEKDNESLKSKLAAQKEKPNLAKIRNKRPVPDKPLNF